MNSRTQWCVAASFAAIASVGLATAERDDVSAQMCAAADCMHSVVEDIRARGWLGLRLGSVRPRGLRVLDVAPGGPAEKAGLRPGDLVLAIGGRPVEAGDPVAVQPLLEQARPGKSLSLLIRRDDALRTVQVQAARLPPDKLADSVGHYVLNAIHLCRHPGHQILGKDTP